VSFADSFPGFRLRLTKWGAGFLVACVILGLAAVNTGNNALMALLGLALGSYVVSGTWSRQVLGAIEAKLALPPDIHAERPVVVDVELTNTSNVFPAYGLVVRDAGGRCLLKEFLLAGGATRRRSVEINMPRRGWHEIGPWRLEIILPLGFFLKSKSLIQGRRVLVYPKLLSSSAASVRRGGGRRSPDALESRGREGDVTQLRDFREGDEVRAMHWKQTARQQHPVVVERQQVAEKPVFYVLDPRVDDPADPHQVDRFERLVSEVATGVVQRLREGVRVGLVVGQLVVPPVRGFRRAPALLRPLAEVEGVAKDGKAPAEMGNGRTITFGFEGAGSK
jgi:uncharacterized protein (DUF58 family)